ncbi:MAG TPA: adenylate/guanylate cyclase domain-containing protein [Gaiellaceae bacterium]|nr:adenylate/guanylate cyclase domain-containing protein [Gaiellaceae bacterium]
MEGQPHRRDLPGGTVTLLFADVEGSTRLLHLLGDRFGPARARMRELVRAAAVQNRGAEVDWAGDGVFLAFSRTRDAITAAVQIQRSLAAEPWPDDEAHRLRIGIHTGEPDLGAEGYVGMDVVIAARVCASAHGEQVVVTRATRDVAGGYPIEGASFRPLGHHRLKDVPTPAQVFQLVAPGLREDFPPLKTLSATSLPAIHHRLVGRTEALTRIEALLANPGVRLVTITGPGGAGKSRLALEVAARAALERPVHLVGLAPVTDAALVPSAIARAVGARESSGRSALESVGDSLDGSGALLYLDNLEHLGQAAAHVAELIDHAPDLQVLATSRAPLRLSTEHVLPLEPLTTDDATTLFVELAAARGVILHDDALATVREICRRLDGLPLAIELVAARLAVLPPAEILRALGEGLALEMEGPVDLPERQRTLRAAMDWSYERLSERQRGLHGALAVFADSGTLDDARTISGAGRELLQDLEALVGWSLIRSESTDGELRLSMLETVREHALDRLRVAGELDELKRRHAECFLALALEAESELAGLDHADWLNRLEREFDNLTAALDWLLSSDRAEEALRATAALERFWRAHAHVTEARRWLALGLASTGNVSPEARAAALRAAALQAAAQSDWLAAESLFAEARGLYREAGSRRDEVLALGYLSFATRMQGDIGAAERFAREAVSIASHLDDDRAQSGALTALADVHSARGQHELAIARYEEAVRLRIQFGDPLLVADAVYHLGMAAFQGEDFGRARRAFSDALDQARELDEAGYVAAAQLMLALIELDEGDATTAERRAREALSLYSALEDERSRARCLVALAGAAAENGSLEAATQLKTAADAARGSDVPDKFETPVLQRYFEVVTERTK